MPSSDKRISERAWFMEVGGNREAVRITLRDTRIENLGLVQSVRRADDIYCAYPQLSLGQVRIDLRGPDVGMPQSSCTDLRSAPFSSMWVANECRSVCGEVIRLSMPAAGAALLTIFQTAWRERAVPPPAHEQAGIATCGGELATPQGEVLVDGADRRLAYRDDPLLVALADAPYVAQLKIDVDMLSAPRSDTRRPDAYQLQHGLSRTPSGSDHVGGYEPVHLLDAEHPGRRITCLGLSGCWWDRRRLILWTSGKRIAHAAP